MYVAGERGLRVDLNAKKVQQRSKDKGKKQGIFFGRGLPADGFPVSKRRKLLEDQPGGGIGKEVDRGIYLIDKSTGASMVAVVKLGIKS